MGNADVKQPRHAATPAARGAFSLIELLVVVGVITILLAILVPAVNTAREHARQVKCLANLRELVTAFVSYAQNNDDRFPRPGANGFERSEDWIYWQPDRDVRGSRILPYIHGTDILFCPSDDPATHTMLSPHLYPYSYSVNFLICALPDDGPPNPSLPVGPTLTIPQVVNPSDKVLIIDECAFTTDDGAWSWQANHGAGPTDFGHPAYNLLSVRHTRKLEDMANANAGKGNVGFCDGHAGMIERIDSYNPKYYDPYYR